MSELVQPIDPVKTPRSIKKSSGLMALLPVGLVAVVLGTVTGYVISGKLATSVSKAGTGGVQSEAAPKSDTLEVGQTFGIKNADKLPDSAEGVLVEGGKEGEGSHHLLRQGGESQNVYISSSTLDLNSFIGHKVSVKGETNKAQKAGWLMEVSQLTVEELNAAKPDWAVKADEKMKQQEELLKKTETTK